MSEHALRILEFGEALEYVAGFAVTEPGRRRTLTLSPSPDPAHVEAELNAVDEVIRIREEQDGWGFPSFSDLSDSLQLLKVEGSVLAADALAELGTLLEAGREVRGSLRSAGQEFPALAELADRVLEDERLERDLARAVDKDGNVLDTASKDLGRIRSTLKGGHRKVVRHLEGLLAETDKSHRVPDASVTIREGRYVIPVRREGKGAVGGYVHDESATGATVFVEPPSAIQMMNQVRGLEREEAREVQRILRELTDQCRGQVSGLKASFFALAELDCLRARARVAATWEGVRPQLVAEGLEINGGRHPLLFAAGTVVVPFDVALEPGERVVIVSGPNTGGKTVFIKSVGLIAALTQSGIIPPVGKGTKLPVFDSFFADVGDEQSLSESLSTFSAHLKNLKATLDGAGARSLVLIDELGTGTDPKEGEALARAIVETLAVRGCTAIVTSHLGGLKRLAAPGGSIVNASLQFDADRMAPTYQFLKGRPGRSYGLAIARGLQFPDAVLDLAEQYRDDTEARIDELLASLETKEKEVSVLGAELAVERERVQGLRSGLEGRERTLRASEKDHDAKARADARKLLLEARVEVDAAIAKLESRIAAGATLADAAKEARRSVEAAAQDLNASPGVPAIDLAPSDGERTGVALKPGVRVRMDGSGAKGTIVENDGGRVLVEVGGVRMRVAEEALVALADQSQPGPKKPGASSWTAPDVNPSHEVDLRGQRVEEAASNLNRALDSAVLGDLPELRVIHGKGTGALKERVAEVLKQDPRIEGFRPGEPGEGGHGVTVVQLR
ncbi:MAG: endonuclease MutS2 [Longimicrobiales bacterium]